MISANREPSLRILSSPDPPAPEVHLLSNGVYHVMVTSAGGGYGRWKDLAITRWREDPTCDNWGAFCYIRDVDSGHLWSNTFQPTLRRADTYEAAFATGHAAFRRRDHDIETHTEISVAPDESVEVRRIRITNRSAARRRLDVTSYAEIVLAAPGADAAHPAFSKLFVETEILRERQAILCTRRPRAPDEPTPWMFHLLTASSPADGELSYETDRARFIGRGRTAVAPQALDEGATLSGTAGPVLDPVAAICCRVALDPGSTVIVDLTTGVGDSRDACVRMAAKYQDPDVADRVFAAAPGHGRAVISALHASEAEAQLYARLAGCVIYASASLRAEPRVLLQNHRGQSDLWAYAISGDLPVVLLRISDPANIDLARQLVRAHEYWRLHGLTVDLVIISDSHAGQERSLDAQITSLIAECGDVGRIDHPGGIFVRPAAAVAEADCVLLQSVARIVLDDREGSLSQQLERRWPAPPAASRAHTERDPEVRTDGALRGGVPARDLLFHNGLGGFTPDGREYVITIASGQMTPAPWVNVLANPAFGTLVSDSGSTNSWSENAQQFRLTPWSNDPVGDANTEAYYIRDEENGRFWSPTLLPSGGRAPYVTRHGFGYSVFECSEEGLASKLLVYVAIDAPVKFAVLKLRNESGRARRLSVTGYLEWVLGGEPDRTRMHVITSIDASSGALFASNPYNTEFAGRTAFFDVDEVEVATLCGDRGAFLGRNGTLRDPVAMSHPWLSGSVGAALDPCAAIRVPFDLSAGQTRELVFRLGAGENVEQARQLVRRWRGRAAANGALADVKQFWRRTLGAVQVETPDRSLDVLTNGWLVYQVLACRLWARNAFYQSSGAFGFRDQLQDVMALVHSAPALVREHLLRAASRQFPEGDVQHWWHPPSGRGVRTRCSDDYLWLPLATCRYIAITGDRGVLDEPVHFLDGRPLKDGEASYYDLPKQSDEVASLYGHCVRTIERSLHFGAHGLPLMGAGDWNDGMNLVGAGGKGESVWLGFFLHAVLAQFSELVQRRGDAALAARCSSEAARLRSAIEQCAWDGEWYRRAWFDDGSPLGTSGNAECRIDSIAQSWSVLSGVAGEARARMAMDALDRQLVQRDAALVRLLTPPFNHSDPSPGYIQGYVRGVRENGGQYTHAAVWAAMAFAALGDAERAWDLFALINPLNHADSPDAIAVYKTEPYVLASDVYALAPHSGRGGWTWYTGAAGWMYQFILESLLGLKRDGDTLRFAPCIPGHWTSFQVHYRYRETVYRITVLQPSAADHALPVTIDGVAMPGAEIPLVDDRKDHVVEVRMQAPLVRSDPGDPRATS